jgi:hypothetical protein
MDFVNIFWLSGNWIPITTRKSVARISDIRISDALSGTHYVRKFRTALVCAAKYMAGPRHRAGPVQTSIPSRHFSLLPELSWLW